MALPCEQIDHDSSVGAVGVPSAELPLWARATRLDAVGSRTTHAAERVEGRVGAGGVAAVVVGVEAVGVDGGDGGGEADCEGEAGCEGNGSSAGGDGAGDGGALVELVGVRATESMRLKERGVF